MQVILSIYVLYLSPSCQCTLVFLLLVSVLNLFFVLYLYLIACPFCGAFTPNKPVLPGFAKQSSQTDASHHRCHSHPATSQGLLLLRRSINDGSGEPDTQPTNYSIEKVRTTSHIRTASFAAGSYGPPTLRHLEIAAACRPDSTLVAYTLFNIRCHCCKAAFGNS